MAAIAAGVGLLVVCGSSSAAAAMMMMGGDGDDAAITSETKTLPNDSPATKKEVFHIGGYTYTKAQGEAGCEEFGAQLATDAQLTSAYEAGANWCSSGWVADTDVGAFPITEEASFVNGCGGTSAGIRRWNRTAPHSDAGKAGLNCYGAKTDEGTEKVIRFNTAKYSRYE